MDVEPRMARAWPVAVEHQLLQWLSDNGPQRFREITQNCGGTRAELKRALRDLEKVGRVERTANGWVCSV